VVQSDRPEMTINRAHALCMLDITATDRQTDRQTDRHTDRQSDTQTDRHTQTHTHTEHVIT
jgi:hypothetical protein